MTAPRPPRPEKRQSARHRKAERWSRGERRYGLVHISVPLRDVLRDLGMDLDAILADAEEDTGAA